MADRFTASFKKALHSGYQLVDKRPDVLRIRPALLGINLVKPNFNLTNVIPVIFVARAVSGANQAMNVALTGDWKCARRTTASSRSQWPSELAMRACGRVGRLPGRGRADHLRWAQGLRAGSMKRAAYVLKGVHSCASIGP